MAKSPRRQAPSDLGTLTNDTAVAGTDPPAAAPVLKSRVAQAAPQKPSKGGVGGKRRARGGLITGVAGHLAKAAAVIGGFLLGVGYLIDVAQSHLLGVGRLAATSHDQYVQLGAGFFIALIALEFDAIVTLGPPFLLLATLAVGVWTLIHRRPDNRLAAALLGNGPRFFLIGYALLFAVLMLGFQNAAEYGCPLMPANLLFQQTDPVNPPLCYAPSLQAIAKGTGEDLFELRVLQHLMVMVLAVLVWFVVRRWSWRYLALAPFLVLLAIYSVALPMLYGVLRLPVQYPQAELVVTGDLLPRDEPLFLVSKEDKELVLYSLAQRKAYWLRPEQVTKMTLLGPKPVPLLPPQAPSSQ